jgi:hypothetical protein
VAKKHTPHNEEITRLQDEIAQLRKNLAQISDELGLPPMMGPAPGELRRLLAEGATAIKQLFEAPRGVSAEADFETMTWTFQIRPECRVAAGTYALVWIPQD